MRKVAAISLLLLALAGCSSEAPPVAGPTAAADPDVESVFLQWTEMPALQQQVICEEARDQDYRGMLTAVMDTGLQQPEAASLLPYARRQCALSDLMADTSAEAHGEGSC